MVYNFHFEVVAKNLPFLLKGAENTLLLSAITIVTSIILGIIVGVFRTFGKSKIENKNIRGRLIFGVKFLVYYIATIYVEIIRGTPLLVQIFMVYFGLPSLGIEINAWPAGLIALTLNSGAYIAEIVRSGIESVDGGQVEASRSLGFNYFETLLYIILPQAIKMIIPPLTSQFAALIKDTSLVSIIAISDLTFTGQQVITRTFRSFEVWIAVAVIYLIMTLAVSLVSKHFERRGDMK
ncbi:amino acid ABC transporter permease [Haliovirga abyssi]|uniref:Amino acid ABC transporter permease n=1 Tax=Haliovirga abyssi TaxID=2996794 RepID=A0AAU9DMU1_9FUSO|nr:amino acid ABC transporter permease [Haliovirga abyssi]BDU51357.1 amino acid ABC transporter permease [Haliovirga abyssi]